MKLFPDPTLPLKPQGGLEGYLLYSFENRGRWLALQICAPIFFLGMWALTQIGIFGVIAGYFVLQLLNAFEARAIGRMIKRASGTAGDNVG